MMKFVPPTMSVLSPQTVLPVLLLTVCFRGLEMFVNVNLNVPTI